MYLLQDTVEVIDWTGPALFSILFVLIRYGIVAIILYLLLRSAIRWGMRDVARERKVANQLFAEQLKIQGADASRIDHIVNIK